MPDLGFDLLFKGKNLIRLLEGLWAAGQISIFSIALSIPLGLLLGLVMTSKRKWLKVITRIYLEFIRIMPQLVLLFIVFFGCSYWFSWNISGELAAIIVFVAWGAAEMGELVRGTITSIPKGQYESAYALGFNKKAAYLYFILPQALRAIIPLTINLITRMIKTTSLVLMIGVVELMKVASQIIEANRINSPNAAFGIYLSLFLIYFLLCWSISLIGKYLEKRLKGKGVVA